jgi:phosphate-selective porin OprO and OprP
MDLADFASIANDLKLVRMIALTAIAALICVSVAVDAAAQNGSLTTASSSATPVNAQDQPAPPPITAGWRDGFYVQSEKGDFRLQIGLLAHADGRFALADSDHAVNDTFLIRRLRTYLRGRISQHFEFYINPDFALGTLTLQDAYVDTIFAPAFRLRIGKAKTPFGFERLQSASNLLFYERALPTAIAPNRDVGIQVLGDLAGGVISYLAGVGNGVPDGGSVDSDVNDGKDVSGRLLVRPFIKNTTLPLRGLGLALSGSAGPQSASIPLPTYRTVSLQQLFFSYVGATADGVRTRYSPQVFYYHKRFAGWWEYVHSGLPLRKGEVSEDVGHGAWQIAGSFVLTGEDATDSAAGIRPKANFDFGAGHWGALQMAARYHALKVDDRAFAAGLPMAESSRKAEAWTVGLNWYLTPNFKYIFNFERTVFDDDADGARKPENAVVFRTQVYF